MLSRFMKTLRGVENTTKLHRWNTTGKSCEIKIKNCSTFNWEDYTNESSTYFTKQQIIRERPKADSLCNEDKEQATPPVQHFSDEDLITHVSIFF